MSKKSTEVATQPSQEVLAQIQGAYPVEQSALRIMLPRLSMVSQDVTEGKGKAMKVVIEAGTFLKEYITDEVDPETGKKAWQKDEIGTTIEGVIVFKRKQLRYYDESTEEYTSSPIYDTDDEVIPIFCNKKEIARDTPANLKKAYLYTTKEGKERSKLDDNRILYILYNGELHQMNLRGSSMYSLMTYERSVSVPSVLTSFSSTAEEKGTIAWNKMSFNAIRSLNAKEVEEVMNAQNKLRTAIAAEKASYGQAQTASKKDDDELDEIVNGVTKQLE